MKALKTLLFLMFATHCTTACFCQIVQEPKHKVLPVLVPKAVQEDFLNQFQKAINDRDLNACKLITFSRYDYPFLDKYQIPINQTFTRASPEAQFVADQINKYEADERQKIEFNPGLKNLSVIPESKLQSIGTTYQTFWDNFHSSYGNVGFIKCSKPLFSKDFNYAVMQISISSKPPSAFLQEVYVFKRVDAKWTFLKKLERYNPNQKAKN